MDDKIKKELELFRAFKKDYLFSQRPLVQTGGDLYCDGELIQTETQRFGETAHFINVGYNITGSPFCKLLSNLFPYEFVFRGHKLSSLEAFFQAIKFKDKNEQKLVFPYFGIPAVHIAQTSAYDWKKTKKVYWQGEEFDRMSEAYDMLADEAYISALQNKLYRNALYNCNKEIIHTIGAEKKEDTVYTRCEFERQLNCLKDFVKQ